MKKLVKSFMLFTLLLFVSSVISFSKTQKPDVYVDPNTGDITYTFYNGPGIDEGNIKTCPGDNKIECKKIKMTSEIIILGPDGYNDDSTYIPSGSKINLFIFTSEDPNFGNGYINITILNDYYPNLDNETEYVQDPQQNIYHNYTEWEQAIQ